MSNLPQEVRTAEFLLGLVLGVGITIYGKSDQHALERFCKIPSEEVHAFLKEGKMPPKLEPYIYKPLKSLGPQEQEYE